jgi:plasmid stability protein
MPVMIQIRHVPEEVHRKIKARAARAGMSMSDFLLQLLERSLEVATREEFLERLDSLPSVELKESVADILAEERQKR